MKKLMCVLLIGMLTGCKDKIISPSIVIHTLQIDNMTPLADGSTVLNLSVSLDPKADADKKSVIFSTSAGMFQPGTDTTITVTANYENGQLVARTKFKVPQVPGTLIFKVRPSAQNVHMSFQLLDTITVKPSLPVKLTLTPSSLGIKTGFGSEISLTAGLANLFNSNVSIGTRVKFEQFPANGMPVIGTFRIHRDTTDATSTATASYTAGSTPGGTTIWLKCTYIDPFGNPSITIKDSCLINVTN